MVRGLKIKCDLVDCICMPIFILASVLFAFAEAIEAPLRLFGQFVYYSYLHFARRFANRQRQQRTGGNVHNVAASLPSEVNVLIFQQMYARQDLKSFFGSNHPSETCPQEALVHYRSLHSAALVCRRWNADATIVLYESVYLDNTSRFFEFARTLLAKPQLCPLVRLLALPHSLRRFPQHYSTDGPFQDPALVAIKGTVDRVLSQCTNARHFCLPLSGGISNTLASDPASSFVMGLRQVLLSPSSRVRTLRLQGAPYIQEISSERDLILPLLDDSDMHKGFQQLTTLILSCANLHRPTLADPRWPIEGAPALPALRRLVLNHYCSISYECLAPLLAQMPALESLQMNGIFYDFSGQQNWDIIRAISQCAPTLTHLRLVDLRMTVTLGNMDHFIRMRSLIVDAKILFQRDPATGTTVCKLAVPPPNLEELVILPESPVDRAMRWRLSPLSLVSAVRDTVVHWRAIQNLTPKLRDIELWFKFVGQEKRNVWRDCEVGTFVLRNLLEPHGIRVNTFLAMYVDRYGTLRDYYRLGKKKFSHERRIERASSFWRKII